MSNFIIFVIGVFVGSFLGIILIAILSAAREGDDRIERMAKAVKEMNKEAK